MSRDRFSELRSTQSNDDLVPDPPSTLEAGQSPRMSMLQNMTGFLQEVQYAQSEIDKLRSLVESIEQLHSQQLLPATEVNLDEVNDLVEAQVSDISKQLTIIKRIIKKIDEANENLDKQTQDYNIRVSQTATCRKRFMDTAKRYQEVQQKHRQVFHERLVREYKIVHPDADDEEVEEALSGDSINVFADQVLHSTRYGEAKNVLMAVQERHEDVKRIEKTILELNSLFQEMAIAVEQQGELINSIEHSVTNAALYTEEATVHLDKAIEYRKSSRRKLYMLMGCCCVLFVIIGVMVYMFAIKPLLPSHSVAPAEAKTSGESKASPGGNLVAASADNEGEAAAAPKPEEASGSGSASSASSASSAGGSPPAGGE